MNVYVCSMFDKWMSIKNVENSSGHTLGIGRSPNWTLRQDKILLDLLIDEYQKNYASQGTFKSHVFQDILERFNNTACVRKNKDNLFNRWRNIKKVYHLYEQLRNRSGWGWDEERNLPVPPDEDSVQAAIAVRQILYLSMYTCMCLGCHY